MNQRSLTFELADDDVLFFVHIPKTAGSSLIEILDKHFSSEEILPLHSASSSKSFEAFPAKQLEKIRLVHGHFPYGPFDRGIYRYIVKNPVCITMLRDPIKRTISEYQHILRRFENRHHHAVLSEGLSLFDFASDPRFSKNVVNRQTYMVAGRFYRLRRGDHHAGISDETRLEMAKQRLEQFAFVGLTERFDESIQLLSYTFGWDLLDEMPRINVSPTPSRSDTISEESRKMILKQTYLDQQLYQFAENLFNERISRMEKGKRLGT